MIDRSRLQSALPRVLPPLVFTAVPLAAFLAFTIQPLMGKRILPIYGGTSGTWLGCMVYFQLTLLLGYAWAAWLGRKSYSVQTLATAALGLVAVVTFHLPSDSADASASIVRVVWRLSLSSLPAMVLVFSASPLLHGWLRRRGEDVPYYLYAISNAGSLIALLLYPFVIEPRLRLPEQSFFWQGLLVIVAGVLATAGYLLQLTADSSAAASEPEENLPLPKLALWLWLSALTCIGLLGATYHLAAELGSTPLAWVGPFGVFLFSFMVTFSGRWRPWMTMTSLVWLAVSLAGFMSVKGFSAATVNGHAFWWLLSLTASGSIVGNSLLHAHRPTRRFDVFYLVLAAGGVLGGLCSGMVIPYLLARPIEFQLASAALLTTGMLALHNKRHLGVTAVTAAVLFSPVVVLGYFQAHREQIDNGALEDSHFGIRHYRDLYGHIQVKRDGRSVVLSSDTTTHGSQLITDATTRKRPTLYYTESTGVGRVLEKLQSARKQLRVGVVGLGAGTLAAYARKDDTFDFWDIDPKALRVAKDEFTYVSESAGKTNLILRDGRKALEDSTADYDVIVIDAFTGDGVPSHLLTREAFVLYFRRLAARNGVVLVHTSSRYSNFFPVVDATAHTTGHATIEVTTDITDSTNDRDWDPTHSEYLIVCSPPTVPEIMGWFDNSEDKGRVHHRTTHLQSPYISADLVWSDDRSAAINTLNLSKYLSDE